MNIPAYTRRLLAGLLASLAMVACDGMIYDDEGDCSVNYRVRFRYDRNMKFADAFAHEVESVTLYLLDGQGNVVWQKTEAGEALASEEYAMTVDVAPGTYDLLAWCGSKAKGSFAIPDAQTREGLTCTLGRRTAADGSAYVDEDLDRLYHGYLPAQEFGDTEGTYEYIVPLTKDTNSVRVVLQQQNAEPIDEEQFTFLITAENGRMDWDNALLPDKRIAYYAWHTKSGIAGSEIPDMPGTVTSYSTVIAELTTARLMMRDKTTSAAAAAPQIVPGETLPKDNKMRLTVVDNETGKAVLSLPLVDYALLVKGENVRDMDDQEFLDRMDEYTIIFVLDSGMRWVSMTIQIHSWKLVFQNTGL